MTITHRGGLYGLYSDVVGVGWVKYSSTGGKIAINQNVMVSVGLDLWLLTPSSRTFVGDDAAHWLRQGVGWWSRS